MVMEQLPLTRASDPITSHQAAASAKPGSAAMNEAILRETSPWRYPRTAFDLAARVQIAHPGRWDEGSIRTAVSRLGKAGKLRKADEEGRSPRGQKCTRWVLA